jgi:hypothetical protein
MGKSDMGRVPAKLIVLEIEIGVRSVKFGSVDRFQMKLKKAT